MISLILCIKFNTHQTYLHSIILEEEEEVLAGGELDVVDADSALADIDEEYSEEDSLAVVQEEASDVP